MEEKKFLTAKEARELAESSQYMKNRVYKCIHEEAKECHTMLTWDVQGSSQSIIDSLVAKLREDGYSVDYLRDEDEMEIDHGCIVIKW